MPIPAAAILSKFVREGSFLRNLWVRGAIVVRTSRYTQDGFISAWGVDPWLASVSVVTASARPRLMHMLSRPVISRVLRAAIT